MSASRLTAAEVLSARTVTVLLLLGIVFLVLLFAPWELYFLLVSIAAAGAAYEAFLLLGERRPVLLVVAGWLTLLALLPGSRIALGDAIAVAGLLYLGSTIFHDEQRIRPAGSRAVHAVFVWCYVFWSLGHAIPLRNGPLGKELVLFVVLFTALRNIAAGWLGRLVPGHKISGANPRKTYEGSLIGWGVAAAISIPVAALMDLPLQHALALSFLLAVAGQVGDLSASVLKRMAGATDSSRFLPGQGGVLDTLDSFLFSVPVAFYYCKYLIWP